jgi:vancomycin permeability regulator SanA
MVNSASSSRDVSSHYPLRVSNYPKGAESVLNLASNEVPTTDAFTLDGVPIPKQRVHPEHRFLKLSWLLLGIGMVGLATLTAAVSFMRSTAAGHIYAESTVPPTPVALVLGAQVYPDGTPSAFLAARLDLAKRLYDGGVVEMIIVSGDHLAPEFDEPLAMRNYLIRAGVPAEKLIADSGGFDTYESCLRAKRIFNLSQLIIVTQTYHLVRAVATCRALGIDATGVGDESARQNTMAWLRGAIRDQIACVKTVVDLVTRPEPRALNIGDEPTSNAP